MDILLIFLFLFVATLIILLGKMFGARVLLLAAFLIYLFVGLNLLQHGYDTATTYTTSAFNLTYYPNTQTNEITGYNTTNVVLLTPQQNDFRSISCRCIGCNRKMKPLAIQKQLEEPGCAALLPNHYSCGSCAGCDLHFHYLTEKEGKRIFGSHKCSR